MSSIWAVWYGTISGWRIFAWWLMILAVEGMFAAYGPKLISTHVAGKLSLYFALAMGILIFMTFTAGLVFALRTKPPFTHNRGLLLCLVVLITAANYAAPTFMST